MILKIFDLTKGNRDCQIVHLCMKIGHEQVSEESKCLWAQMKISYPMHTTEISILTSCFCRASWIAINL